MAKPPVAALYIRVSDRRLEPRNQVGPLRALCKAHGWAVGRVYRDIERGGNPARLAFNAMQHDASVGKIQVVVFWAWDRITRGGVKAAFAIMDQWRGWNVAWTSLQEPYLSSTADPNMRELLLSIVAWAAKQESLRISQRTKAAIARRRGLGLFVGRKKGARDKKPRIRRWRRRPLHG